MLCRMTLHGMILKYRYVALRRRPAADRHRDRQAAGHGDQHVHHRGAAQGARLI